jgi:hypothetical protein
MRSLGVGRAKNPMFLRDALRARQGAESIARKILKARLTDCNDFLAFTRISHHKDFPP